MIKEQLQGFFKFLIFMHPKVMKAKISPGENTSWCQAFYSGSSDKKKNINPVCDKNTLAILSGAKKGGGAEKTTITLQPFLVSLLAALVIHLAQKKEIPKFRLPQVRCLYYV